MTPRAEQQWSADVDEDALNLATEVDPEGGVRIAASGYLDDDGGAMLEQRTRELAAEAGSLCIDLHEVTLFNCSGARRLIAVVHDLEGHGRVVELVGVNPTLEKALHLWA